MTIVQTSTAVHAGTIPGLKAKRGALQLELYEAQADAHSLAQQINHVDSILETLGISRNPRKTIRETFRGENAGLVLAVLEAASRRLTANEIAHQILMRRQLPLADRRLLRLMALRVRDILHQFKMKGIATSIEGPRPLLEWALI